MAAGGAAAGGACAAVGGSEALYGVHDRNDVTRQLDEVVDGGALGDGRKVVHEGDRAAARSQPKEREHTDAVGVG